MKIKKQHIISWLLDKNPWQAPYNITFSATPNGYYNDIFLEAISHLRSIKESYNWGLPELLTSSFYEVMKTASKSFVKVEDELFNEFCTNKVCGILLIKRIGTIVYCFHENYMHVWIFREAADVSVLYMTFCSRSVDGCRMVGVPGELHKVTAHSTKSKDDFYTDLISMLMSYIAVKRHAKVEVITVPDKKTDYIKNFIPDYQSKEAICNESGQEVIIMDSRWFREIINNNTIFVRDFLRWQWKKNETGEWYKELIVVASHERHGYHRKAGIQKQDEAEKADHTDYKI